MPEINLLLRLEGGKCGVRGKKELLFSDKLIKICG